MVQEAITILIADRNPRVREFLRREFRNEGFHVLLAKSGREVLKQVYGPGALHVLVLDPDLPDASGSNILDLLEDRTPSLPVVLHGFSPEHGIRESPYVKADAFVEKQGNSVDRLKTVVRELLSAEKHTPKPPAKPGARSGPIKGPAEP